MWGKKLEGEGGGRRRRRQRPQDGDKDDAQGRNKDGDQSRDGRREFGQDDDEPVLSEAEDGGSLQENGEVIQQSQREDNREKQEEGGTRKDMPITGVAKQSRQRKKDNDVKNMTGEEPGSSTGGRRGMRTPQYSRTLNRASAPGLGSSDIYVWRLCVQLHAQGRTKEEDACGGHRAGGARGSGRPPPWPPPPAWRIRMIL